MLRVLIVEDSFATRVCYRLWCEELFELLGEQGTVHEVSDLNSAKERLAGSAGAAYGLALVDISFPRERKDAHGRTVVVMDPSAGLDLCELMGKEYPGVPTIVASSTRCDFEAVKFLSDRERCPSVCAFVQEPFTQERFLELVLPLVAPEGSRATTGALPRPTQMGTEGRSE